MKKTLVLVLLVAVLLAVCAAPAGAKSWKKVKELSGSGNNDSTYFALKGGTQKLTWKLTADSPEAADMLFSAVYVMKKGTTLEDDGGIPAVMPDEEGTGSAKLHIKRGTYYLAMRAANCSWKLALYEWR